MIFLCDMIYFVTVLLFGTAVSFSFAGIPTQKKSALSLLLFCSAEGLIQISISHFFGMALAKQLYPLFTHLPLILYLAAVHKCTLLVSVVSVLSAYLCCQIPWWCAYFSNLLFPGKIAYTVIYELSALITFGAIYKYIAEPTEHFMKFSRKSALLLGGLPLFYYCFDYATTVYTDWLYSGNPLAVQFMPSVIAFFYFLFIIIYYRELSLKEAANHEAETLRLQLQHAASTLDNMQQIQQNTITYRHDIRHHLNCMQMLASSGNPEKLQSYIRAIQSGLEAITPKKFCQNEVINLILSSYSLKAEKKHVLLNVHADVPDKLSISDTNLCAILSNALENALYATENTNDKMISARLAVRNSSLLIQISNPFSGEVTFRNTLPVTARENHGTGTKSIAAIVDAYNGQYTFSAENQLFTLRILLPL